MVRPMGGAAERPASNREATPAPLDRVESGLSESKVRSLAPAGRLAWTAPL